MYGNIRQRFLVETNTWEPKTKLKLKSVGKRAGSLTEGITQLN
jgi:hypothetical protein